MNILTKSIITLTALAATGLHAEVFPIAEDTFGTISKNTILKASGAAKSIAVSAKTKAYIGFDVGGSGIPASSVTNARLTIYVARASKTGNLYLANALGAFSETFADKSIPMPSDAIISTTALTDASSREYVTFDVTNQVKNWLTTPSSEHGFVLTADGTLAITIATKEGAGTGHPAILEVDVNRGGGPIAGTSASFSGTVTGAFSGDGAALTNLNGANVTPASVDSAQLANGAVTASKLGADVGLWTVVGANVSRSAGSVAIGTTNADRTLQVDGDIPAILIGDEDTLGRTNLLLGVTALSGGLSFIQSTSSVGGTYGPLNLQKFGSNVGIGTDTPNSKLTVNGEIETLTGGVKFPDGSVQTKAAPGTGATSQFLCLGIGAFIAEDSSNLTRVVNYFADGTWATGTGALVAPVQLPAGAQILSVKAYVYDTVAVNLYVSLKRKNHSGSSTITTAFDFEVAAGTVGHFNQTDTGSEIITGTEAYFLRLSPVGGAWPGNNTLSVQNVAIEWRMP